MAQNQSFGNIVEVDGVLLHTDILTEHFCCDLTACHGQCCVEGDAGAPLTLDEVARIENVLERALPRLSEAAREVIARQGVCYTDVEGDLVTSIVQGRDCAFLWAAGGTDGDSAGPLPPSCARCALQDLGAKPISCSLYPIREKRFPGGLVALNYHRWSLCHPAVCHGRDLGLPVYRFLREPLVRRFGQEWYDHLEQTVAELHKQHIL